MTGEIRIVIDHAPPRIEPPLKLKVEVGKVVQNHELDRSQEVDKLVSDEFEEKGGVNWQNGKKAIANKKCILRIVSFPLPWTKVSF